MSEPQSNKRGLRSVAQKEAGDADTRIPPANDIDVAFGGRRPNDAPDEEWSLAYDARLARNQARQSKK